jgi:uncharacterized protein YlxW (UPF0749 family)
MSDRLEAIVARLRSGSTYDDRTDAADLIEAQEAEITRLRAEREALQKRVAELEGALHQIAGRETRERTDGGYRIVEAPEAAIARAALEGKKE